MTDKQINAAIAKIVKSCWADKKNYCNDLNAMHLAEWNLSDEELWRMACHIKRQDEAWYFRASARQRAEAFLRTLGLWEEAE
jgi:hypothetical protein